ncbi:MAG: Flp pilus assembly protein CpaB [Xanthobacteraceae bacterium]
MKAARLVVLGIAVVAGGVAALLASGPDKGPPPPAPEPVAQIDLVDVLVAKADIGIGQGLTADQLQWQAWPAATAGPAFIRRSERPNAIEQLSGSMTRTPFAAGEPIREAKLVKANGSGFMAAILPAGMRAISTEISAETGAGGFILPNDRVDVILSQHDRVAEKRAGIEVRVSDTILKNVKVLAIDQTVEEKNGQKVVVGKTATLELTSRQAETLANARQVGTLSLALRSLTDANAPAADSGNDDKPDRRGGIDMVRYGVSTNATPK